MGYLTHLLTDTITVQSEAGRSSYGDATFGATTTYICRVERVDTLIVGIDNNQYRATHRISLEAEITYTDRIWLPGANTGDVNESNRPIRIDFATRPGSTGHYEVYF